jgi:electron transport complex protein RnfB
MSTPILSAILVITGLALVSGLLLSVASKSMPADSESLVEKVNELLPQTQCAQCGYPGCKPYANAILGKDEAINLCPPGGQETVDNIAALLGRDSVSLAEEKPSLMRISVAAIDEALCIGCTHCIEVCPVDAIVGAQQFMHTIIASECTGCELCLPRCPVDCIRMVAAA